MKHLAYSRRLFLEVAKFVRHVGLLFCLALLAVIPITLLASTAVKAEQPPDRWVSRTWKSEHGLCHDSVTAITQTPDGYIWVGTEAGGLSRFDGVRFESFGLADGMQALGVTALENDGGKGLWIGTAGGLSRWREGRIETLTTQDGLLSNGIYCLARAGPESVWIGTAVGLQRYGPEGFTTVKLDNPQDGVPQFGGGIIRALASTERRGVWISVNRRGCFRWQDDTAREVEFPEKFSITNPTAFLVDQADDVWAGMGNGVILHSHDGKWTEYNDSHGVPFSYVTCMVEDTDGRIWIGSLEEGLYRMQHHKFERVLDAGESIRALFASKDGTVWVGAKSGGLTRLTKSRVHAYPVGVGSKVGTVQGIAEDDGGEFWIATWGGSLHRGRLSNLQPVEEPPEAGYYPAFRASFCGNNGQLYFVGPELVIIRDGDDIRTVDVPGADLTSVCQLANGEVFFGGRDGGLRRLKGNAIETCQNGMLPSPILSLCAGDGSQVWIATADSGIACWDQGHCTTWTKSDGLPTTRLLSLYHDGDETVWMGTAGAGLAWLRDGAIYHVNRQHGLPNDVVSAILADDAANLWLGTPRGIVRCAKRELFDVAEGRGAVFQPFLLDETDGMPSAECTSGYSPAGLRTRNGTLLFSTYRHVVEVNPSSFQNQHPDPHVLVEAVEIDGQRLALFEGRVTSERADNQRDSEQRSVFTTGPGVDDLRFEFTALGASRPLLTKFRHRLVGLESDWSRAATTRSANFTALPPGQYRFQVNAANASGAWTSNVAEFRFMIRPFYWQTWWFRSICTAGLILATGTLTWLAARDRVKRSEDRHRLALAQLEAQQHRDEVSHLMRVSTMAELSSSFAHELSQPLAAILSNAQSVQRALSRDALDRDELKEVVDDIVADDQRASEIIKRIRTLLKRDPFHSESIDLNEVIQQACRLLAPEFEQQSVGIERNLATQLPTVIGDRVHLQQVVINLLMNAAEAMEELDEAQRRITVSTSTQRDDTKAGKKESVVVRVLDSGLGVEAGLEARIFDAYYTTKGGGLGLGLSLCRSIVTMHGGTIGVEPAEAGTIVYFALPVSDSSVE